MRNQLVILAGGQGKRMGNVLPKVLVMLKQKPLILHLLHELEKITQLIKPVIVVGYKKEAVMGVLGDQYFYAFQEHQLGTAHAVFSAKSKIKAENILVLYGDMPFIKAESLKKIMRLHRDKDSKITMLTTNLPNFEGLYKGFFNFGRIIRGHNGKIIKITEFRDASERERKILEINPGIYIFNTKWLWENIKKIKNKNSQSEYYLTDIVEVAIEQGLIVNNFNVASKEVIGINSKEDLEEAEKIA